MTDDRPEPKYLWILSTNDKRFLRSIGIKPE